VKPQDRTRAIGHSRLPGGQKLVLLAISDHMGTADNCFPGIPAICAWASMSEKQVKAHVKALDLAGVLRRKFRPGTLPPIYSIDWEVMAAAEAPEHNRGGRRVKRTGAKTAPVPTGAKTALQGKDCPSTGAKTAPPTGAKTALRSDQGSDQEATSRTTPPTPPTPPRGGAPVQPVENDFGLPPEVRSSLRDMVETTMREAPETEASMLDPPLVIIERAQQRLRKVHPGVTLRKRSIRAAIAHYASQCNVIRLCEVAV